MDEKTKERVDQLQDSKAKRRESAAKALRKMACPEAGPFLQAALEEERKDRRTWSSQYHMILALGFCEARQALPLLREMAGEDHAATILYLGLGDALFRLMAPEDGVDSAVRGVAAFRNPGLIGGAMTAMAMTRSVPSPEVAAEIITLARDPQVTAEVRGYPGDATGYRKWVAVAAADWDPEIKDEFLRECLEFDDQHLTTAATASLQGKYTKWQPY